MRIEGVEDEERTTLEEVSSREKGRGDQQEAELTGKSGEITRKHDTRRPSVQERIEHEIRRW